MTSYKVHKGDRAIVFNGYALQQDSYWGKKTGAKRGANKPPYFSDDHDLVIVPIHWRLNKVWDMNAGRWKNSTKSGTWRRSFAPADSGAQPGALRLRRLPQAVRPLQIGAIVVASEDSSRLCSTPRIIGLHLLPQSLEDRHSAWVGELFYDLFLGRCLLLIVA